VGTFFTGNTALPAPKVDVFAPEHPQQESDAADFNNLWDALGDVRNFLNYPENAVSFPPDFPATGITFTRDAAGTYSTSFDPDAYAATWGVTLTIFVNPATGNDTTGTGLVGAPYLTVSKAIDVAVAAADTAIQITIVTGGADVLLNRDVFIGGGAVKVVSGKRLYITPDNTTKKVYVSNTQTALTWTLNTGATYQAARSNVTHVLDMSSKDAFGIPLGYTFRSSIATVDANPGSWWTDGTTVYVRTLAGAAPVAGTHLVQVGLALVRFNIGGAGELYLRNLYTLGGLSHNALIQNVSGDYTANKLVCYNCAFTYSNPLFTGGSGNNGIAVESLKVAQFYNCIAAYNSSDGFNFHYTRADPTAGAVRGYYGLAFGCSSYNNGIGDASATLNTNNGYTAHEGANFAAVACAAWNTQGALFAFVNGCYSVLIGCTSRLSAHTVSNATFHAAYYFDNGSAPAGVTGKAYLDDCEGNDTNLDLATDGSNLPITLREFAGSKITPAALPYIRWLPSTGLAGRTQKRLYTGAILNAAGIIPTPTLARPAYQITGAGLLVFANNAAAIAGGLRVGNLYRTGADPDLVCVVH
jgi:hypothetical protein